MVDYYFPELVCHSQYEGKVHKKEPTRQFPGSNTKLSSTFQTAVADKRCLLPSPQYDHGRTRKVIPVPQARSSLELQVAFGDV